MKSSLRLTIQFILVLNCVLTFVFVHGYAQLADTMMCADESCSETISEGKARLAYRPRDNKFLNLEKGDVVLVKSKNAGKKSHLWGGQVMGSKRFGFFPSSFIKEYIELVKKPKFSVSIKEFLNSQKEPESSDLYSGLIGEKQKITFEKSRKKRSTPEKDEQMQKEENKPEPVIKSDINIADNIKAESKVEDEQQIAVSEADHKPASNGKDKDEESTLQLLELTSNEQVNQQEKKTGEAPAASTINSATLPPTIAAIVKEKVALLEDKDSSSVHMHPDTSDKVQEQLSDDHIVIKNSGGNAVGDSVNEEKVKVENPIVDGYNKDVGLESVDENDQGSTNGESSNNGDNSVSSQTISTPIDNSNAEKSEPPPDDSTEKVLKPQKNVGNAEMNHDIDNPGSDETVSTASGNDSITEKNEPPDNSAEPVLESHEDPETSTKDQYVQTPQRSREEVSGKSSGIEDQQNDLSENVDGAPQKADAPAEEEDDDFDGPLEDDVDDDLDEYMRNFQYSGVDKGVVVETTKSDLSPVDAGDKGKINKVELTNKESEAVVAQLAHEESVELVSDTEKEKSNENLSNHQTVSEAMTPDSQRMDANVDAKSKDINQGYNATESKINDDPNVKRNVEGSESSLASEEIVKEDAESRNLKLNKQEDLESTATDSAYTEDSAEVLQLHEHLSEEISHSLSDANQNKDADHTETVGTTIDDSAHLVEKVPEVPGQKSDDRDIVTKENPVVETAPTGDKVQSSLDSRTDPMHTEDPHPGDKDVDMKAAISDDKHIEQGQHTTSELPYSAASALQGKQLLERSDEDLNTALSDDGDESSKTEEKISGNDNAREPSELDKTDDEKEKFGQDKLGEEMQTIDQHQEAASQSIQTKNVGDIPEEKIPLEPNGLDNVIKGGANLNMDDTSQSGSNFVKPSAEESASTASESRLSEGNDLITGQPQEVTQVSLNESSSMNTGSNASNIDPSKDVSDGLEQATAIDEEKSPDHLKDSHESSAVKLAEGGDANIAEGMKAAEEAVSNVSSAEASESPPSVNDQLPKSDTDPLLDSKQVDSEFTHVHPSLREQETSVTAETSNQPSAKGAEEEATANVDETGKAAFDSMEKVHTAREKLENMKEDENDADLFQEVTTEPVQTVSSSEKIQMDETGQPQTFESPENDGQDVSQSSESDLISTDISEKSDGGTHGVVDVVTNFVDPPDLRKEHASDVISLEEKFQINGDDALVKSEDNDPKKMEMLATIRDEDAVKVVAESKESNGMPDSHQFIESAGQIPQEDSNMLERHDVLNTLDNAGDAEMRDELNGDLSGFTDLRSDKLLQWFIKDTPHSFICDAPLLSHFVNSSSIGFTNLYNDMLLCWFLPKQTVTCDAPVPESVIDSSCIGFTDLYNDLLLRWFLPKPTDTSNAAVSDNVAETTSIGFTSLHSDMLLRWFLPKQTVTCDAPVLESVIDSSCIGFNDLNNDLLLRWFLPKPTDTSYAAVSDNVAETTSIGFTSLHSDMLIRWFLPKQTPAVGMIAANKDTSIRYSNLYDDPLIKWFLPKTTPVPNLILHRNHEHIGYTDLYEDAKVKWFLPKITLVSKSKFADEIDSEYKIGGFTNLLDDKMLGWILIKAKCRSRNRFDSDVEENGVPVEDLCTRGLTDLRLDPLLKWFVSDGCLGSQCNCPISDVDVNSKERKISTYLDDNLLKYIFLNGHSKARDSMKTSESDSHPAEEIGNESNISSYMCHPLLKWFFLKHAYCPAVAETDMIQVIPEGDTVHTEIVIGDECSDYLSDRSLESILPGNPDCELKRKRPKENIDSNVNIDSDSEPVVLNHGGSAEPTKEQTLSQSSYFDNPSLGWLPPGISQQSTSRSTASIEVATMNDEVGAENEDVDLSSPKFASRNTWIKLRNLLTSFQSSYENSATFRIGLADLTTDLKILIKTHKSSAKPFHSSVTSLRNNIIKLENEILASIQDLSTIIYSTGLSKKEFQAHERDTLPKYETILESTETKVQNVLEDMKILQKNLQEILHERKQNDEDSNDLFSLKESDEIDKLQEKLSYLDQKLSEKSSQSSDLVKKMELEAQYFRSRIAQLEESLKDRKRDEEKLTAHSEERERKLEERIESIKSTIAQSSEEKLKMAREESEQVSEKLKKLEASMRLTVEADKPLLERIAALEEELSTRKNKEYENARYDKSQAILLRSKIQALERQLKKQHHIGSSKMLLEARDLKEKVRTIENSLSAKADHAAEIKPEQQDAELKQRIANLESEFKERMMAINSQEKLEETVELKNRVQAMEERLQKQIDTANKSKSKAIVASFKNETHPAIKPFRKDRSMKKKSKINKLKKDEIMKLLNAIFFQKTTQSSIQVQYSNQSIATTFDEYGRKDNSAIDFKCTMDPLKRKACGAKHYTKEFCNALQCCWNPVLDDPSIPPCYFSLLQLNDMNKMDHAEKKIDGNYMEQLNGGVDADTDKYHALHEGKVVDWDETLEGKPTKPQSLSWDESLGSVSDDAEKSQVSEMDEVTEQAEENASTIETDGSSTEAFQDSGPGGGRSVDLPLQNDSAVEPERKLSEEPVLLDSKDLPAEDSSMSAPTVENEVFRSASTEPPKDELGDMKQNNDKTVMPLKEDDTDPNASPQDVDTHDNSFWVRLVFALSSIPGDIFYVCQPLLDMWVSLLPVEYQNDVYGVPWLVIISTFVLGFIVTWLLICRSQSVKRRYRDEKSLQTIQELRTQLENLSQEKVDIENDLRTKLNEVQLHEGQMAEYVKEKDNIMLKKAELEQSVEQYNKENDELNENLRWLNKQLQDKDKSIKEMLANSQKSEKSVLSQQEMIKKYEGEIKELRKSVSLQESSKKEAESSVEKLKERIKNLEKSKGETKKEGKILKDQIEKLNVTIEDLQQKLDSEIEESDQKKQEIDVLKDCILQFKGANEYLADGEEEGDSEEIIEKQKEKMKSMFDVASVKSLLRQTEADKLQVTYELEAERKSRIDVETKVTEMEALIQSDEAIKSKLERDKQTLESKLSVMQDFYAKREVEIQSKLGREQSRSENNASLLEDQQKQHIEVLEQLQVYKKMCDESKQKYDDSERKHKQEVMGFEKKAHENWLACREAERKFEEANKQISQLQLELSDMRMRLHPEREAILRPRPERHGPPGAPPFGPPRRGPPPPLGTLGSPLHFRNGPPPDSGRVSPTYRGPPSPGGSIPGDGPPSRPDRPPSTHSLPPMDRRPPSGPPIGPGGPYGRIPTRDSRPPPFREGGPPMRPSPRDLPPHARPPPGPGVRNAVGPMTSSPYMERPPIPPSHSPGPRSQAFTQSSLHATPPHPPTEGLKNDSYKQSLPSKNPSDGPPLGTNPGVSNPFRRSKA